MFDFVHEVAVIGTTFFMMAFAMVWYSEYLFQKPWLRSVGLTEKDLERASDRLVKNSMLTFFSYLVVVYCLALMIGFAQVYEISVKAVAASITIVCVGLLLGFVVWEQRSMTYYYITAGFASVFILGSTFFLYYWPW